jgi:tRNA pseudouridine55 synthase
MNGLLLVDKPPGPTSHDVVARARKILRTKKIGHCGTLDPDATGLLVLTIGRATRLTRFLIRAPKVYEGTIRLGVETDTYDLAGEVVAERPVGELEEERLREAMERHVGTILPTPPPYCAKKVGGVKYYELARRGEEVPQEPKEVTVYEFAPAVDGWRPALDGDVAEVDFRLACASGTYARSLAHDVGRDLGTGGVLARLRRTHVGSFSVEEAVSLEALATEMEEHGAPRNVPAGGWIPFDDIPLPFGEVVTDPQQERRIQHGQTVLVRGLESREGDWIKVMNQRHQFIAVGSVVERIGTGDVGIVQPKVVFH